MRIRPATGAMPARRDLNALPTLSFGSAAGFIF